jgi:hypothetical protein
LNFFERAGKLPPENGRWIDAKKHRRRKNRPDLTTLNSGLRPAGETFTLLTHRPIL